ncbi:hypothetical protein Bbelb_369310 [Branchiostoma belcheri]|nr:hypothetical protein Bbelb_369310 [Branchiostoma belcheri]
MIRGNPRIKSRRRATLTLSLNLQQDLSQSYLQVVMTGGKVPRGDQRIKHACSSPFTGDYLDILPAMFNKQFYLTRAALINDACREDGDIFENACRGARLYSMQDNPLSAANMAPE